VHITRSSFLFGKPPESYALYAARYENYVCFHLLATCIISPLAPKGGRAGACSAG
jgi:hypothetical protein